MSKVQALRLSDADVASIDGRFPAARLLRVPRAARRPRDAGAGDVVLVVGLPGAGKSSVAAALVEQGYARLNRDETGGCLSDLLPGLERLLSAGHRRVVLDNTYGSRAARNAVIETAWAHGVPARCVWLQTSLEDAQVNVVQRMLSRYGRLLEPDELKDAARRDPGALAPQVLYRHRREFEAPNESEGFARIDNAPFQRHRSGDLRNRALIVRYDTVIDAALPACRDVIRRHADEGWIVLGLSWRPAVARGTLTPEGAAASFARASGLLGTDVDWVYCPHGEGPPVCWCRKPLPGLGVVLIERHRLDPARCLYVGRDAADQAFARALGFTYRSEDEVFA